MHLFLGTFFGIGRLPGPSGTYASAVTAALMGLAHALGCPWWGVAGAAVVLAFAGVAVAPAAERRFSTKDPRPFVLDEVVGMLLAGLPAWCPFLNRWTWATLLAAFFWFRAADIFKPPPIRQAERLAGGWGIMADDVLAGVLALALTAATAYLLKSL